MASITDDHVWNNFMKTYVVDEPIIKLSVDILKTSINDNAKVCEPLMNIVDEKFDKTPPMFTDIDNGKYDKDVLEKWRIEILIPLNIVFANYAKPITFDIVQKTRPRQGFNLKSPYPVRPFDTYSNEYIKEYGKEFDLNVYIPQNAHPFVKLMYCIIKEMRIIWAHRHHLTSYLINHIENDPEYFIPSILMYKTVSGIERAYKTKLQSYEQFYTIIHNYSMFKDAEREAIKKTSKMNYKYVALNFQSNIDMTAGQNHGKAITDIGGGFSYGAGIIINDVKKMLPMLEDFEMRNYIVEKEPEKKSKAKKAIKDEDLITRQKVNDFNKIKELKEYHEYRKLITLNEIYIFEIDMRTFTFDTMSNYKLHSIIEQYHMFILSKLAPLYEPPIARKLPYTPMHLYDPMYKYWNLHDFEDLPHNLGTSPYTKGNIKKVKEGYLRREKIRAGAKLKASKAVHNNFVSLFDGKIEMNKMFLSLKDNMKRFDAKLLQGIKEQKKDIYKDIMHNSVSRMIDDMPLKWRHRIDMAFTEYEIKDMVDFRLALHYVHAVVGEWQRIYQEYSRYKIINDVYEQFALKAEYADYKPYEFQEQFDIICEHPPIVYISNPFHIKDIE